jgi:hypothetical protein
VSAPTVYLHFPIMQFLAFLTAALLPVFVFSAPADGGSSIDSVSLSSQLAHMRSNSRVHVQERQALLLVFRSSHEGMFLTSILPIATQTALSSVTSVGHAPSPTSTSLDNGACDTLVQNCIVDDDAANSPYGNLGNVFNKWSCVMAFACRAPAKNVNQVLQEMWDSNLPAPTALKEPRLSENVCLIS